MNIRIPLSLVLLASGLAACSSSSPKPATTGTGGNGTTLPDGGGTGATGAGTGGAALSGTGGNGVPLGGNGTVVTGSGGAGGGLAVGHTQCSDGIDNDGDGRIDLADVECVSPLDNDESSFATGIPGDNKDACKQDCFFDGNSGMGDDGCNWDLSCDPANVGTGATATCPYDPSAHNCPTAQSAKCVTNCGAVTPNGCDCFGCCSVPGVSHPVRLDATCTAASFNDPTKCPACTQRTDCMNTCGKCQYCLGKTTLDPSCTPAPDGGVGMDGGSSVDAGNASDGGTPAPTCPGTQIVCGLNASLCPNGTMCVTGCCVPWIF